MHTDKQSAEIISQIPVWVSPAFEDFAASMEATAYSDPGEETDCFN